MQELSFARNATRMWPLSHLGISPNKVGDKHMTDRMPDIHQCTSSFEGEAILFVGSSFRDLSELYRLPEHLVWYQVRPIRHVNTARECDTTAS